MASAGPKFLVVTRNKDVKETNDFSSNERGFVSMVYELGPLWFKGTIGTKR